MDKIILSFPSYTHVYGAQKKLLAEGIKGKIQRASQRGPEEGCGFVLIVEESQKQQIFDILTRAGYKYKVLTTESQFWGGIV